MHFRQTIDRSARGCALLVSACGALALALWLAGRQELLALGLPGAPLMKPGSALGFMLAGLAIAVMGQPAHRRRRVGRVAGLCLLMLSLASLACSAELLSCQGASLASPSLLSLVFLLMALAALRFDPASGAGVRCAVVASVTGTALSMAVLILYTAWWLQAGQRLLLVTLAPQSAVLQTLLALVIGAVCMVAVPAGTFRRHATLLRVAAIMAMALIGAWGLILATNSASIARDVSQRTDSVAQTLLEHMHRSLDPVDLILRQVSLSIGSDGMQGFAHSLKEWRELSAAAQSLQQLSALLVIDREGRVVSYSAQFPAAVPGTFSHRDYFVAHQRGETVYLGPLIRAATGKYAFTYSRRINDADGRFAGVVVATLELGYFRSFYRSLNLGPDGSIGMFRTDARTLVREPMPDNLDAVDMARYALFARHVPQRSSGSFVGVSPFDGTQRFIAFRVSNSLPLVVTAAVSAAPLAAEFSRQLLASSILLTLAIVVLVGSAAQQLESGRRDEAQRRQLEAGKAFTRAILDSMDATVAITDRQGNILDVNKAWMRFSQANAGTGDYVGRNYLDIACGDQAQGDGHTVARGIAAVMEGSAHGFEHNYECSSATEQRWFKVRVTPLTGSDGCVVISHENVTDLKLTEMALRQAQGELRQAHDVLEARVAERTARLEQALQRLTLLINNSPLAVLEWDREGRITRWSRRAEEMFGWRALEVIGRRPEGFGLVYEEDRDEVASLMAQMASGDCTRSFNANRNHTKDGGLLHCEWHNAALLDGQGQMLSVLSLVHDVSARHGAETARQESEDRFRNTFEQAAVGIAHVGLDGRWLRVNQRLCEMLGRTSAQLHRLTFADITHAADLQADLALVDELLRGQRQSYSMQKRYVRADGSLVWAQLTVSLRRDGRGEPLHFISVVQDIQALKDAEDALIAINHELEDRVASRTRELQASEQHIREIAATVPGMLYQWYVRADGSSGFYYLSPRVQELYGHAPEHFQGSWLALVHDEDRATTQHSVKRAIAAKAPWQHECRILHGNGSVRWVRALARPVRCTDQETVYTGVVIDVTDERLAQDALFENELRYQTLIEGSLQGILVKKVHDDFKLLFANDVAARMYGYGDADELLQEPDLRHLIPEEVQQGLRHEWERMGRGDIDAVHTQVQGLRKDGTLFWLEIMGRRIDWEGQAALQATIMDITERQRLEAELKRQATIDSLTSLLTRRQFNVLAEQEIRHCSRYPQQLTALMVDVDHFKRVNDTYGHHAGDKVLAAVAETLRTTLRGVDLVGRFGGEEFVALLVGADESQALLAAQRLRRALAQLHVRHREHEIRVTASVGISAWRTGEASLEPALGRADEALYAAKANGRDQAVVHGAVQAGHVRMAVVA